MTDNEIIQAFDVLEKMEFFGGQRAGRELWFNKPIDIQNKGIGKFLRDIDFLKTFINSQQAEIERLKKYNTEVAYKHYNDGIKEFADRVKMAFYYEFDELIPSIMADTIDSLVKEMVGDTE